MDTINFFFTAINFLKNKECWSVIAGEGTGSNISLEFGNKIPRKYPIKNMHLTENQRQYTGEFSLFITCSWRMESCDSIICGSKEPNNNDGSMVTNLKKILNKKVIALDIKRSSFDFTIHFEDNIILNIFCDETDPEDDFDNYSFFCHDYIYTIKNRSLLDIERRVV